MKFKDHFKFMVQVFCWVNTFQILFIAIFARLSGNEGSIALQDLWRYPAIALVTTLPMLMFIGSEKRSRAGVILTKVIHFLVTGALAFGSLFFFGILRMEELGELGVAAGIFLAVYVVGTVIGELRDNRVASQLNDRLAVLFSNEEHS